MQPPVPQRLAKIQRADLRGHTPLELLFLFRRSAHILADGAMQLLGPGKVLAPLADRASHAWLVKAKNPYLTEIELIAAAMGRPGTYLLNVSMEWGCTSGGWMTPDGPMLRRVLDWPFPHLGELAVVAEFRGKLGDYHAVTWPGFTGVLHGMAPGRFAGALNQGPLRKEGRGFVGDWLTARVRTRATLALPPAHLLRRVFETARDYTAAKSMLCLTPIAVPAIFTLTGTKKGEASVIERSEDGYAVKELTGGRVCTANHFQTELKDIGKGWRPRPIDSAGRLVQALTLTGEDDGFGWLAPPIANVNSRLAISANAATGMLKVLGLNGAAPVTEVFDLNG